jgi:23S rRNA (uracil1939-C5)-methyltransferase
VLIPGQTITLDIEKPAAGGRMIARVEGQVVFVLGAIPGERAVVRIDRVRQGIGYGEAVKILSASPDRRDTATDPACGGCVYAPIAYVRQLALKSLVIADALARIGRIRWPEAIAVRPSPETGYRMRARAHYRRERIGWFRENTHELCDIGATGQLLPDSVAVLQRLERALVDAGITEDLEIELSENIPGDQRVIHLESARSLNRDSVAAMTRDPSLTGLTIASPGSGGSQHADVIYGGPTVSDVLRVADHDIPLSRHVLAFFQGNRHLVNDLVNHVVAPLTQGATIVDLYAGAGLFALSAAVARGARVIAVEGDRVSSADLARNAAALGGGIEALHQPVEHFIARPRPAPDAVIVDPPRTGMSKEALRGILTLGARRLTYVSCDVATFARDARAILEGGYALDAIEGFDLFPNTPHVETVARFVRG